MKHQDFILYKKELNAFRKADTAYAKKVLAFAKKEPNNEHVVVASCLLINDAEKFFGNNIPLRKTRATQKPKPVLPHPLKAWEAYEEALTKALEIDGKHLQTLQTFDGENIAIEVLEMQSSSTEVAVIESTNTDIVAFIATNEPAIEETSTEQATESISDEAVSSIESETLENVEEVVEDTQATEQVYVEDPLEAVSDAAEMIDDIVNEEIGVFEEDSVELAKDTSNISEHVNLSVSKEYVAPEELVVDNSIVTEEKESQNTSDVINVKPSSISSGGFNLKSKEYVAPQELVVDNHIEASNIVNEVDIADAEIYTVDSEIIAETNLTVHDKDYVAPEELTIDNSIKVQNIIVNPKKKKQKRRGLFEKKIKPVEYSGVHEENNEVKEYTRNDKLDLFSVEDEATRTTLPVDEKPKTVHVDERTLAEANEYVVGSEADLKLKSKEYAAPEELTIDNSLPEAANVVEEESSDTIYVETLDNVIESNTEIRIKSKEYVAPEELVVDNSITDEEVKTVKKRGLFGRKRKDTEEVKAQPVVFLPPKPIEFDTPEAPAEGFVYKRKSAPVQDVIIEEEMLQSLVEERESVEKELETEELLDEVLTEYKYDTISDSSENLNSQPSNNVEIDFNELAEELAKERLAKEQVVYAKDKHVSKAKDSVDEYEKEKETEAEEDVADDYLERQRLAEKSKTGFDTSSIIKDIKIIDI